MTKSKENLTSAKENQGPMGRGKKLDSLFDNPKKKKDEPFELAMADQKRKSRNLPNTGTTAESTSEDLTPIDSFEDDLEDDFEDEAVIDDELDREVEVDGWEEQATTDSSTEQVSNDPERAQQQTPRYESD